MAIYTLGAIVLAGVGIAAGVMLPLSSPLGDSQDSVSPMPIGDPVAPFTSPATLIPPLPPIDTHDLPHAIVEGVEESADRASAHWLSGAGLSVFSQTLAEGATLLQQPHPHLPIRWSVTAAGGDVMGERLSTASPREGINEAWAADSATWFVNIASGEVLPSGALLAPEAESTLTRLLSEAFVRFHEVQHRDARPQTAQPRTALGQDADMRPPSSLGPVSAFTPPYDDLSFTPDGALIVTVPRPRAQEAPNSGDPSSQTGSPHQRATSDPFVTIRISPETTKTLLTADGQRMRNAIVGTRTPGISPPDIAPAVPLHPYPLAHGPAPAGATTLIGATPTEDIDCAQARCVALTFDDGPDPTLTPRLLDILFRERVHVTFFIQGDAAVRQPRLIVRALREGHTVGTHTWSHPRLPFLSAEAARQEITRAKDVVIAATGRTPILMRPPYGEFSSSVLDVLESTGDAVIMWNVDTEDWKNKSVPETTQRALDGSRPGSIILMHDVHPTSVQSVPGIIQGLRNRGFSLVSIPTLLGPLTPGDVYYGRP